MTVRWKRRFAATISIVALFFGVIEVAARINVGAERRRRAHLGDQLFVRELGSGSAIVFIPGLQGSTRYWGRGFDTLSASHRLLYIDTLGFGLSPWPKEEPTLEDHLAYLRRTLVARGATRNITIVAHSFGTILAAHYAARYPTEVQTLILLGTPVFRGEADAKKRIRALSSFGGLFSLNPVVAREACMLMGATRPLLEFILPRVVRSFDPGVLEDSVLHNWSSVNGALRNVLLAKPIEAALASVRSKVIMIHGRRDQVTDMPRIEEVARKFSASLVTVPGDHQSYVRESQREVQRVIETCEASH